MTDQTLELERIGNRLAPQPSEIIDRDKTVTFSFNGKSYTGHLGDTIASALSAAGVQVLSRSFKYHRPRGLLCCAGHCPNCLVQVGDEPNVRACQHPVENGMEVQPQNVWPSLDFDIMSMTELGDRFLPVGFYYKTFIRPQFLWPTYEHILRNVAGLGEVNPDTPPGDYDKQYLFADVAVVGGGPAGLNAATTAANQGAHVLLFDENSELGGHLRFTQGNGETLKELSSEVHGHSSIDAYTDTTVLGWFEDNWLYAVQGTRFYKIRARTVVFGTGSYEQPLLFDNNDLPGIMLGSAVHRLLHLYSIAPGSRAVVITANDDGWRVAADLQAAGVTIMGVADERSGNMSPLAAQLTGTGIPVFKDHTILAARGNGNVREAVIAPVRFGGGIDESARKTLACDLIVLSVGWAPANGLLYQAGGEMAYNHELGEFLPVSLPKGIYAAGGVNGSHSIETQMEEGRLAGLQAAAHLGLGTAPSEENMATLAAQKAAEPPRTSDRVTVPGMGKHFLCLCEDVTENDLEVAVEEGYNSMELLKRYSTITMGPCQGKMCSQNTVHLCARANNKTIEETGITTPRPPMTPIKMGNLAGKNMEPVAYTPIHDWHLSQGAKMMVAGLWMRPEHYGDPAAEVRAVRERVGLIDVSTLGKLKMIGPGIPDLLDKIYVNKWQKLGVGRVRYGVMCNDEGVVMDDGVTAHLERFEWYTTTTSSGATAVYEWIQWWAQSGWGEGVHVTNITENFAAFNLAGPRSRDVLENLTEADISKKAFPYMHIRSIDVAGVPCHVFRIGFTGELSYEIHCPAGFGLHLWEALMEAGKEFDILPFGVEAQRVLRLEKSHVIVGQDTDALTDPISADMAWVVNHDKPNFLGNRPLARIANHGPRQKLVGFKMVRPNIVPDEGLQIVRETGDSRLEIIGWVTSSRFSTTLNEAIGLCWLPAEMADQEGRSFTVQMNGGLVEGRVHHGAFYDPEGDRLRT